jgi:hypothetical protein
MKHIRANTSKGQTARAMINWAQTQAGTSTPVLETHHPLPQMESKWLQHLREGLMSIKATIHLPDTWTYPPVRINDSHIMDDVLTLQLCNEKIRKINYCRQYLQVTHVSDIASSDGKKLHPLILSDQPDKLFNQMPTLNWAIQDCPSAKTWKIWKETIQALYCSNGRNLTTKLGKWTLTHKTGWHITMFEGNLLVSIQRPGQSILLFATLGHFQKRPLLWSQPADHV